MELPVQSGLFRLGSIVILAAIVSGSPATAQTITSTQNLSFGTFAAGTGGTVTVSPQSARTATGDVTLMTGGQFSQGGSATFDLTGSPNGAYQITLPPDGQVTLTGSQGGSMAVSTFTSSPSGQGQLNLLGAHTLSVGATLGVGSNQAPGTYSGSFNVTIVFE
jgi:hypothetical protein